MSLFDDFQQGEIIDNPWWLRMYRNKPRKKTDEEKKKERKELSKKMKAELSPEEFNKWRKKEYYQLTKDKRIEQQLERYYRKRKEEENMLDEIYRDVYDPLPEPINYDKLYIEKFKNDDVDSDGKYRFSWRSSKIIFEDWKKIPRYKQPIRIYWRRWINTVINNLLKEEWKAYKLLLPHLSELEWAKFMLKKYQSLTKYPLWNISGKLSKLCIDSDIAPSHICNVLSAIQRGKYIASEAYLWRNSFIMGDVIVTQTGHMFQPCLENNIDWLTPNTIDAIHNTRMKWRKKKWKEKPPIYMLSDAYLIKIPINERENYYYLIPT